MKEKEKEKGIIIADVGHSLPARVWLLLFLKGKNFEQTKPLFHSRNLLVFSGTCPNLVTPVSSANPKLSLNSKRKYQASDLSR